MHPASLRPDPHASTHSLILGYVLWVFGFMGLHRFYYGKPVTGTLWLFTFGLLGVGWLVDVLLIPRMNRQADLRYRAGPIHYSLAWVLLLLGGWLGLHRMYLGDRKSTRLNSSHVAISYAVFCLKKKQDKV